MPTYLSKSRLEDYLNCGRLYQGRHILKKRGPTKWELVRGGIVHQAIQAYHAEPEKPKRAALVRGIAEALFNTKAPKVEFDEDVPKSKAWKQIDAAIQAYLANPLPDPEAWEVKFAPLTRGDIVVNGRWDLVYPTYPAEIKVSGKLPGGKDGKNQDEIKKWADEKIDGPIYAWAWKEAKGKWPEKILYYVIGLFENKEQGIHAIGRAIEWPVQPAMVQLIYDNLEAARRGIAADAFPAHWGSWLCGGCEFRKICLKEQQWKDLPDRPDFKTMIEAEEKEYQDILAKMRRLQIPKGGQ